MKPIFNTLIGLLLLIIPAFTSAQVLDIKFNPTMPTGAVVGSVITVDVVATQFEGIVGMQFPILYDKNKLQFKTIKNLNPDLPAFIYNEPSGNPPLCPGGLMPPCASSIGNPIAGKISLLWFDPSGTPNYLDPNVILFRIEFTVLQTGTSNIYISPSTTPVINVIGMGNVPATFTYPVGAAVINGFALIVPRDSIRPGEIVCMPVQVNDFINVVSMQFMVNYDAAIFSFSHVQSYGLAGLDCSKFNTSANGRVAVQWEDLTGAGVTLPNGTAIFEVCLLANGPNATNGTTSNVACNGAGMPISSPIEIATPAGVNLWLATSSIPGPILISNTAQLEDEIVKFRADTVNVMQVGDSASIAIKVRKFKNINHFQFVASYDVAVLGAGLPRVINSLPNTLKVELIAGQLGKLRISWRPTSAASGQTFADEATIFVLRFPTNTAVPGAMTPFTIGSLETVSPTIPLTVQERPNGFMAPPNTTLPTCAYKPRTESGWVKLGNVSAVPSVILVSKTDVNCFGNNIGAIDITVTGGLTTVYTYKWSGPGTFMATTQDLTGLAPGTYQVTVTAGTASSTLASVVVIAGPTAPIAVPTNTLTLTNVKCFGGTDGAISISPTGGSAPYTYNWGGGITTQNRTGLSAGTYNVTITDSKNCTFAPTPGYSVNAPTVPMAATASNVKNIRCFNDVNGGATINTTGSQGALSYVWKNAGGTTISPNVPGAPTNLAVGTYSVTITDGNQCTAVTTGITVNGPNSQLNTDPPVVTSPLCAGQNNGSICFTPFGGWGSYSTQWGNPVPGVGLCPTGVASGTYNITITDAGGCAIARAATVSAGAINTITNVSVTDVSCHDQGDGSISISLSSSFTSVNWTRNGVAVGSGTTISNLGGGDYVPTVNFGTGCTIAPAPSIPVVNPAAIVTTQVAMVQENNGVGGSLDISSVGGTGALTYSWAGPAGFTGNTQDISNLPAGTYTVTVKDTKNCQAISEHIVTSACLVCAATVAQTQKSCVTDGCFKVTVPAGAPSPFILKWANSVGQEGTKTYSNTSELVVCDVPAGLYSITVTDANSQSIVLSTSITQRPQVTAGSTEIDANLDNKNGSISITPGPGIPLSYMWLSGNITVPPNSLTSPVIFQLDSGEYCVKLTNILPEGCEEIRCFDLVRLYPNLAPCGTPVTINPTCLGSTTGSIDIFPQGGDNTFKYLWSNGMTTQKISGLAAGIYTCTVTSGDGQTGTCGPYTLTNQSLLAISNVNEVSDYNGFQVSGTSLCNGAANAVITGAGTAVSYLWSNGVTTANNTTLCGGTYTVVATDQLGCTSSWTGALTSPTAVNPTHTLVGQFNGFGVSCFDRCDGSARVNISGGVAPYFVKWPSGKTDLITNSVSFSFENSLCAGDQVVEVTDANGVIIDYTITLTEPDPISFTFTDTEPLSLAECNGEIIPTTTGTVGTVTYNWYSQFHQGDGLRADGLCSEEEVTFVVIDANGCTATAEHTVPVPQGICFKVNPVLTPNGDGNNDYFEILCIASVPNTVEIYDRWNQAVVKPIVNYQNNWDGKRNGVLVPEGTYFYVVTFINDLGIEMTLKGYFNILY